MCNNPSPSNGGNFCFGYSSESSGCDCIGNIQIYVIVVNNFMIITFLYMFLDFLFEVMQLTACNFQLTGNGENGPTTEIAVRLVILA